LLDNPVIGINGSLSKLICWLGVLRSSVLDPVPWNTPFMVH